VIPDYPVLEFVGLFRKRIMRPETFSSTDMNFIVIRTLQPLDLMNRLGVLSTICVSCLCMLAAAGLTRTCLGQDSSALPQAHRPPEKLHGVLSRQRLTPPLRSTSVTLRFSPDGRYLLFQDPSGIYVLSHEPLKVLGYIDAPYSYEARFSGDSQCIIVVSLGLSYQRWTVKDWQSLDNNELPIPDGCVDAQLSPDGELLACYRPDFSLGVLKLSTGQWIFSDVIHATDPHLTVVPIPLDRDTAFAGPFGFTLSHDMKPIANRGINSLPMRFSPDGSTLIAGDARDAVRVDLVKLKKTNLPVAIQKQLVGSVALLSDTRVLVISRGKPREPAVRSLANGDILATPQFNADSARIATDPRYALLYDSGMQGARLFDLKENRPVETPKNIAADINSGKLAIATDSGDVFLYEPGEDQPSATVTVPVNGLPILRSVSVSPILDRLAIAVDGAGGLYRVANGQRISILQEYSFADFTDPANGFLLTLGRRPVGFPVPDYMIDRVDAHGAAHAMTKDREATLATEPQTMLHLDILTGKTSPIWTGGPNLLRSGGPVLFEYSFEGASSRGMSLPQSADSLQSLTQVTGAPSVGGLSFPQGSGVPFHLRALDPTTGEELWSRSFTGVPPIPFADPQSDRLVLGWKANSAGAWAAAKNKPVLKDALKKAKLTERDSFLEALDARTGKSVGGVLVQSGTGPLNFDSIVSAGDAIICSRDAVRIYIYSMLDGQLKARLVGVRPSANAQNNLLALSTGSGQLTIYDLNTTAKLDEQVFPDQIAYTHFSVDGQRLLVLTENQDAFVMDMTGVRLTH
jgi:hypothetical protein